MKTYMKVLSKSLIFLLLAAMVILPANAALVPGGAVGPVAPAGGLVAGFPVWYQDQNGIALELMEAADGFGISAPVEPGNPFSQQIGFGPEGFWWSTEADIGGPGQPLDGIMVLAMEAAFAGESAVDGEQSAFGRVRFVFSVPATGTYTVTYPYGTKTFVVDAVVAGPEIINTADTGCLADAGISTCDPAKVGTGIPPLISAGGFAAALSSGIGPFLTWDTFNLDPALTDPALINPAFPGKRYVGNVATPHLITGSPTGNNFVRVVGPAGVDLDPALAGIQTTWQTDLFSVSGRIAVVDTIPPAIAPSPIKVVAEGAANIIASVTITDDLGVRGATIDLSSLGNNFAATLNGAQEVPLTTSTATGTGTFTVDTAANTLSFNIAFGGLTGGAEIAAHIHGPAAAGVNALPVFDLNAPPGAIGSPKIGVWNYTEPMEADILAGRMYVNIHSLIFSSGEIRGQILPASNVQKMVLFPGNLTNGTWSVVIPGPLSKIGTFNLPITANDGSNVTTGNLILTVVANAIVTAVPTTVTVGNLTPVTITVTQGGVAVSGAIVNLSGAVLPALQSNITDAAGHAIFSINATGIGPITVTANNASFVNPGVRTINAVPLFVKGEVNPIPGIDVGDVLFCAQFVAGVRTPTPVQRLASDVNTIPGIDVGDVLFIAQAAAGLRQL